MKLSFEDTVRELAREMPYPPTPEITLMVQQRKMRVRRLAWSAALVILVMGLVAVPPIRAALRVQLGAVIVEFLPFTGSVPPLELENMVGKSTYQAAVENAPFTLRRPAALSMPDHVFVQGDLSDTVIFVWVSEDDPQKIETVLYQLDMRTVRVYKVVPEIEDTQVMGEAALWIDIPHPVWFEREGAVQVEDTHLVTGNVLIWQVDAVAYRLETGSDLETAVAIAESLE